MALQAKAPGIYQDSTRTCHICPFAPLLFRGICFMLKQRIIPFPAKFGQAVPRFFTGKRVSARNTLQEPIVLTNKALNVSSSGRHGLLKALLLLGVFLITGYAFSENFSNRFAQLEAKLAFKDESGTASREEKRKLAEAGSAFKDHYGVKVLNHIYRGVIHLPALDNGTIFLAVSPPRTEDGRRIEATAMLAVPPLVRGNLPQAARVQLEQDLALCADSAPPAACMVITLHKLFTLLKSTP